MKKIIAILTQKGSLSKGLQEDTVVNLFKMDDEKVIGVENLPLEEVSDSYFSFIMTLKEVSLVYVDTISQDLQLLLEKLGITTKCKDDIVNDGFINHFVFD